MGKHTDIIDRLDRINDRIEAIILRLNAGPPTTTDETVIEDAIDSETVLGFHYVKLNGEPSVRIVSPYEVRGTASGDHLVGYDHGRDGLRQFSIGRVEHLTALDDFPFHGQADDEDVVTTLDITGWRRAVAGDDEDVVTTLDGTGLEVFTLDGAPAQSP